MPALARRLLVIGLLAVLQACGSKSDAELMLSAKKNVDSGNAVAAVVELKSLLQKQPSHAEARHLLGTTLLEMGDANGAAVELTKALELKLPSDRVVPTLARAMLAQGKLAQVVDQFRNQQLADPVADGNLNTTVALALARMGKMADAKTRLQGVLAKSPSHGPALVAMGRFAAAEGNRAGALDWLNKAVAADAKNVEALLLKGEVLSIGGKDFEGARAAFGQAITAVPTATAAHAARISTDIQYGKLDLAKADLAEMQKLVPNSPQTKFYTAIQAFGDHDYKRAMELANELEQWAPNDYRVLHLLAALHLQNNDLAAAQARLVQASRLNSNPGPARLLQAQLDLRLGQPQKALEGLAPLLEGGTSNTSALTIAAQAHQKLGNTAKSDALLAQALRLQPNNAALKSTLALTELAKGNAELGFAKLDEISKSDSSNVADLAAIGARMKTGTSPELFKDLDRLERKEPNKPMTHDLRARALLKSSDLAGARRSFEQALKLDPNYFPSAAGLAAMDRDIGDYKAAIARFGPMLKANPKNLQARMAVVGLKAASGADLAEVEKLLRQVITDMPRELEPRIELGERLLSGGRVDDAVTVAQEATTAFPIMTRAFDLLGRAQMARRDMVQAAAAFKKMAALDNTSVLAQRRLAELNAKRDDYPEAIRNMQKAVALKPDDRSLLADLFALTLAGKQFDTARKLAKDLQKDKPRQVLGLLLEGDLEAYQKNWLGAAEWYRKALAAAPTSAKAALKLYDAQTAMNKPQDAKATMDAWLKKNPKDIDFRLYLAEKTLAKRDYALAENQFREVLALAPQHASTLNNVAWLMARQGKPGAAEFAQRAVKIAPEVAPFQDTLALALLSDGQVQPALDVQRRLVARVPQAMAFRLTMAKIQIQAGKKDEARAELGKLAALGSKFAEQDEVAALMRSAGAK